MKRVSEDLVNPGKSSSGAFWKPTLDCGIPEQLRGVADDLYIKHKNKKKLESVMSSVRLIKRG